MRARLLAWLAVVLEWWPFDGRDALLTGSVAVLGVGLAGWDWRIAGVTLGVLGIVLWALPLLLARKAG